jgi:uncharacterized protein YjbI with pentapeptide repeats
MDRDEALKLFSGGRPGLGEWNRRRREGEEIPDLGHADLSDADLSDANLSHANLSDANLSGANLEVADLARDAVFGLGRLIVPGLPRTSQLTPQLFVKWTTKYAAKPEACQSVVGESRAPESPAQPDLAAIVAAVLKQLEGNTVGKPDVVEVVEKPAFPIHPQTRCVDLSGKRYDAIA